MITVFKRPLFGNLDNPRAFFHLSLVEFLFWLAAAFGGYVTVFLQREGYKADQIGFLYALCSVVSILATPFWGMIADKIRSIRKILMFCLLTGALLFAVVPFSQWIGFNPVMYIFIVILLGTFFRAPIGSLLEIFVVQRADTERITFSHVRLWGSISYMIMCFILSRILPRTGVDITFYLYGIFFLPLLIVLWKMKGQDGTVHRERHSLRSMGIGRLFKSYYFVTFLIFCLLIYIPLSTIGSYLPLLINATGDDAAQLGLIYGYTALLEIPMLILIRPLRKKIPLPIIIFGGVFLYGLGTFLYSRADSILQIFFFQTFHGLGSGLLVGSITSYVFSLAPEGLISTANTLCGAAASSAGIIGNLIAGVLITALDIHLFYLILSLILIFAMLFFIVTLVIGIKVLRMPLTVRRN